MMFNELMSYGLKPIGSLELIENDFQIRIDDEAAVREEKCIYAFVVNDEIVRIGSSKARLRTRFNAWQRDVSNALHGRKSPTPQSECEGWRDVLRGTTGAIWARQGSFVQTPMGEINAYLAEEAALIAKHKPRFCPR